PGSCCSNVADQGGRSPLIADDRRGRTRHSSTQKDEGWSARRQGPLGGSISAWLSSSTLTSLKVSTFTVLAKRAGRYMSHTQASLMDTSKNTSPASVRAFTSTWLHR